MFTLSIRRSIPTVSTVLAVAALVLSACAAPSTTASTSTTGNSDLSVKDAWARPSLGGMAMDATPSEQTTGAGMDHGNMAMGGMTAAYMLIENKGAAPDTLLSVNGDVAEIIQIHETKESNGMMSMQELKNGLEIPASGSVTLKPASYHIMIMNVKKELKVGDTFKLTLKFKSGKELPVDVTVRES